MTSQTDQIQTLIQEIDEVLSKASPRLPWVMSAEAAEQRKVLEQTRRSLLSLQQQIDAAPPSEIVPVVSEESAQQVLQAFLQEMNYLRSSMLQPLRADIERLNRERDYLSKDIQQLQEERQQLRLQGDVAASQQQMLDSFLTALMNRLQESLSSQIAQTLSQYEQEARAIASSSSTEAPALPPSELPLTPRQRLEHIRQTQARSDQLLMKLDSTLEVIFESLQSNVQGYQDSLSHGLEKMHNLGQQGEAMFAGLVNRLAEQLGREASAYLQASLESEEKLRSQAANLANRPDIDSLTENLDDLSDEQIDRLLDELNGNSTEPASGTAAPSFAARNQDDDDDRTVFQIDERRLQRYDEEEDVTVLQNQENAVEAARAMMLEAARRREAQDEAFMDDEPTVAFVDPRKIDNTLDWLGNLNDEDDRLDMPVPTEGVPDSIASDTTADPAIDQPENLYEDDFYNSLFGDSVEDDLLADLGMDDAALSDRADTELEAVEPARYPNEEDEILNEDANQELFGGLSDPSVADDPAIADDQPDAATESLMDDAGDDAVARDVVDEDLVRDASLSGLSTQALQNLFPDGEPLFAGYVAEDDESTGDDDLLADLPPLDETDGAIASSVESESAGADAGETSSDASTADPANVVGSLFELIEQEEPSGFLDTRSTETSDDDRYMPASPDEDLIGAEEDTAHPLLELDEQTLSELETDLSRLENADAPAAIAAESLAWEDQSEPDSLMGEDEPDWMDEPTDESEDGIDLLASEATESELPDATDDTSDDSVSDLDEVIALNAVMDSPEDDRTASLVDRSADPSADSPFDLSDDLSVEDLFEVAEPADEISSEVVQESLVDSTSEAIAELSFPDTSEFIDESLTDPGIFDEFETGDEDLMEEAESLFDTVDTPTTMMDVDDLLLPDPPQSSNESDAPENASPDLPGDTSTQDETAETIDQLLLDGESYGATAPAETQSETLGDWFLSDEEPSRFAEDDDADNEPPADFLGALTDPAPETLTQKQESETDESESSDRFLGDWFLADDEDEADEPPAVGVVSPDDVGLSLGDVFGDAFGESNERPADPLPVSHDSQTDATDDAADWFGTDEPAESAPLQTEDLSDTTLDDVFGQPDDATSEDSSLTFDDAFGDAIAPQDEIEDWAIDAESDRPEPSGLNDDWDEVDGDRADDADDLFGSVPSALDAEPDAASDPDTEDMIDTLFTSEPIFGEDIDEPAPDSVNTASVNDTLASLFDDETESTDEGNENPLNLDNRFTLDNFLEDALESTPESVEPAPPDELSPLDTLSGGLFGMDADEEDLEDEPQEDETLGGWFEAIDDQPSAVVDSTSAPIDNDLGMEEEGADEFAMENALNAFADAVEQDEEPSSDAADTDAADTDAADTDDELSLDALFGDGADEEVNAGLENLMDGWGEESEQYTIDSLDELFGDDDSSEKKSL